MRRFLLIALFVFSSQSYSSVPDGYIDRSTLSDRVKSKMNRSEYSYTQAPDPGEINSFEFAWDVAQMYHVGLYYDQDQGKALEYAKRASELGSVPASYYYLKSLPRGSYDRVRLLEKGAANDHPESLYDLALHYHEGEGVPNSVDIALFYLSKSASKGLDRAIEKRNEIMSLQYNQMPLEDLLRNVRMGDKEALGVLSQYYRDGVMVKKDQGYADLIRHNRSIID